MKAALSASDNFSNCSTLLFANKKLTLLIAAFSWLLLTRGIVDDQKCGAGVSADEKRRLQKIN
jgi:hypothetical protein